MTPNEIVHKAMGLAPLMCRCFGCMNSIPAPHQNTHVPDYSQPEHIGKVYAWMQIGKGKNNRWLSFETWIQGECESDLFDFLIHPFDDQIKLIAEWITEGVK